MNFEHFFNQQKKEKIYIQAFFKWSVLYHMERTQHNFPEYSAYE